MKLQKFYNILIGDRIYYISSNLGLAFAELERIKKFEPTAQLVTTYA